MREIKTNDYTITYPDKILFAFNCNVINVKEAQQDTHENVTFIFYRYETNEDGELDIVESYVDEREFYKGKADIDISKYVQYCFYKGERNKMVTVAVLIGNSRQELHFNAVWGVLNVGETWNTARRMRRFVNYPQTFGVYVPEGAQIELRNGNAYNSVEVSEGFNDLDLSVLMPKALDSAIRVINGMSASSVFDKTFDITFGTISSQTWLFDVDESDTGVYLRWIDRHGWQQYWLFKQGSETEISKNDGEELSVSYTDSKDISHYGMVRSNKAVTKSVKCCAVNLDADMRKLVASVCASPYVDMWDGASWIPVRINDSKQTDTHAGLVDYEIEVLLPNVITQTL